MEEKRKHKRLDLEVRIELERLDQEVDTYYDTKIQIWTKEVVDAVVQIVRRQELPDGTYKYGGSFIGMTDTDALKIDSYQIFNDV